MTLHHAPLALLFSALLLPACGGEGEEGPDVDCGAVAVPNFSEVSAFAKCVTCHSAAKVGPARAGAPAGIDFDDYAAARANAEKGMEEVYEGEMPPAGSPELTEAEKTQIYNWASCDTPQ